MKTEAESNRNTLGVLIVDDHPLFRKGLRTLLSAQADIQVLGEASNGDEAVELAEKFQPDLILMDLHVPGRSGIAATREIVRLNPHIRILIVTMFEDDESVFAALRAGARGYVLKNIEEEMMLRAIRAAGAGEAIFSPAIASRLIDFFATPMPSIPKEIFPTLTDREREILDLIAQGFSNVEISQRLTLSLKTVGNHVSNIYNKLQVADRAQAILRARDAGLGQSPRP